MAGDSQRRVWFVGAGLIAAASALAILTFVVAQWPLGSATDQGIDDVFVARMLEMDAETSEIASLAETHAEHQELRRLAEDIVRSLRRDGALMGSRRVDLSFPALMRAAMRRTDRDAVVAAPVFDKAFIEVMMVRYRQGIEWCSRAFRSARGARVRMLASELIASRARELVFMRVYYEAWYGTPPSQ